MISNTMAPRDARVSDLLCMSDLSHASSFKEHDHDDDIERLIRPTAEWR